MNFNLQMYWGWLYTPAAQTAFVVLAYVVAIMTVRWSLIALPTRAVLQAQIDAVRVRFRVDQEEVARQSAEEKIVMAQADKLLSRAEELIFRAGPVNRFIDRCLWSRGQESQGWRLVHEAERVLVQLLPKEQLRWRLHSAKADLAAISSESEQAKGALTEVSALIEMAKGDSTPEPDLRACVQEVLRLVFGARDNYYEDLVNWHNKALFLIAVGIGLALLLALADQHPMLLLMGAVGGFLGRLARSLQGGKMPVDYGAYWTTLFLSPIAGALAAWAGVLLIGVLSTDEMKVLGEMFNQVSLPAAGASLNNPTMAVAFLLGFSERFFMQIVSTLESRGQSQPAAAVAGAPATAGATPLPSPPVTTVSKKRKKTP